MTDATYNEQEENPRIIPKKITIKEKEIYSKFLDYIRLMRRLQTISLGSGAPHHWTMHDAKSVLVVKHKMLSEKMAHILLETLNYHSRDQKFTIPDTDFVYDTFNIYSNKIAKLRYETILKDPLVLEKVKQDARQHLNAILPMSPRVYTRQTHSVPPKPIDPPELFAPTKFQSVDLSLPGFSKIDPPELFAPTKFQSVDLSLPGFSKIDPPLENVDHSAKKTVHYLIKDEPKDVVGQSMDDELKNVEENSNDNDFNLYGYIEDNVPPFLERDSDTEMDKTITYTNLPSAHESISPDSALLPPLSEDATNMDISQTLSKRTYDEVIISDQSVSTELQQHKEQANVIQLNIQEFNQQLEDALRKKPKYNDPIITLSNTQKIKHYIIQQLFKYKDLLQKNAIFLQGVTHLHNEMENNKKDLTHYKKQLKNTIRDYNKQNGILNAAIQKQHFEMRLKKLKGEQDRLQLQVKQTKNENELKIQLSNQVEEKRQQIQEIEKDNELPSDEYIKKYSRRFYQQLKILETQERELETDYTRVQKESGPQSRIVGQKINQNLTQIKAEIKAVKQELELLERYGTDL